MSKRIVYRPIYDFEWVFMMSRLVVSEFKYFQNQQSTVSFDERICREICIKPKTWLDCKIIHIIIVWLANMKESLPN